MEYGDHFIVPTPPPPPPLTSTHLENCHWNNELRDMSTIPLIHSRALLLKIAHFLTRNMEFLFNKFVEQKLTPLNSLFLLKRANFTPAGI